MASAVTAAERKVIDCKELVQKRTVEFEAVAIAMKKRLSDAKAGRERANASLKTARESLAVIRKKHRPSSSSATADKPKRIAAPNAASKRKSRAAPKAAEARSVCTLCHKEITDPISAELNCGCHFHMACVARWRERGRVQCPTCLAPMENSA